MFKGVQNVLNKVAHRGQVEVNDPSVSPILKASELLAGEKFQQAIQKLPAFLNLDEMQFNAHCAVLINNFAEYVQRLPETQNSYFSGPGGVLEHGFHRSILATSMCHAYFLPKAATSKDLLTQQQILWTYAVFSAGLLHDVGKLAVDLQVTILDRYQNTIKPWNPWEGSMLGVGTDYKCDFSLVNQDEHRRRCTLLLARQLMPHQSYLWIASNADVLAAWLAILEDDERGAGIIGAIILRADAEIIRSFFLEKNRRHEKKSEKTSEGKWTNDSADKKTIESAAVQIELGQDFVKWLQEALEKQTIKANRKESGVIRVAEGVLLTQKVFEKFVAENPTQRQNWQAVANAVTQMGLHERGTENKAVHHYVSVGKESSSTMSSYLANKEGTVLSGILIKNVNMAFHQTIPPEVHQNFIKIPYAMIAPAQANSALAIAVNEAPTQLAPKAESAPPPAPVGPASSAR